MIRLKDGKGLAIRSYNRFDTIPAFYGRIGRQTDRNNAATIDYFCIYIYSRLVVDYIVCYSVMISDIT